MGPFCFEGFWLLAKTSISCNFRGFSLLPQTPFLQNPSFLLVLLLCFFCLPFQKSIFLFPLSSSTPFENTYFCSIFLIFPSLSSFVLLSFKQTSLTSPLSNPSCFHIWLLCSSYFSFLSSWVVVNSFSNQVKGCNKTSTKRVFRCLHPKVPKVSFWLSDLALFNCVALNHDFLQATSLDPQPSFFFS